MNPRTSTAPRRPAFWGAVLGLLPLLLASPAFGEYGVVQTTSRQTFEGHIRLRDGAVLISDPGRTLTNRIDLAEILLLRFQPPPADPFPTNQPLQGLRGTYFDTRELDGRSVVRLDPVIDFDWRMSAPVAGIGPDHFSVRWEGYVLPPVSETFTFFTQTDDGVRLWVHDRLLIDQWQVQSPTEWSGSIDLVAGRRYRLKLEYFEHEWSALARLLWSSPTVPRAIVPADRLTPLPLPAVSTNAPFLPPPHGLLGLYFNALEPGGEFRVRYDPAIDFDWGEQAPLPGLRSNKFSVRWLAQLTPPVTESYTFHAHTDDGVRLWIDGRLVLDAWRAGPLEASSPPVPLLAGHTYDLRLEMFDVDGRGLARLFWSSPILSRTILASEHLTPAPVPDRAESTRARIPAGLMLAGGSILPARITAADDTTVRFSLWGQESSVSTVSVSRLLFQSLAPEHESRIPVGRTGLLLSGREFMEGEFAGLSSGRIRLTTVLFGTRSIESWQALAVVLRPFQAAPALYELRTRDECLLLANALRLEKDCLTVQEPALAGLKIPTYQLLELRRLR